MLETCYSRAKSSSFLLFSVTPSYLCNNQVTCGYLCNPVICVKTNPVTCVAKLPAEHIPVFLPRGTIIINISCRFDSKGVHLFNTSFGHWHSCAMLSSPLWLTDMPKGSFCSKFFRSSNIPGFFPDRVCSRRHLRECVLHCAMSVQPIVYCSLYTHNALFYYSTIVLLMYSNVTFLVFSATITAGHVY